MPAFLVPIDSGQCLIPLEKAIVMIGREADCDVSLTHSRKVSRKHCCIAQVNSSFVVRDLGSTNGVFLNGNRIKKEAAIEMGDDLTIGDVRFKLLNEAPASNTDLPKVGNVPLKKNPANGTAANAAVRNPAVPPIPKIPEAPVIDLDLNLDVDEDPTEEESDVKNPNTLDGIRRYRSNR